MGLAASLQAKSGGVIKPLWGTAQLFVHPRYMHGAATSQHARQAPATRPHRCTASAHIVANRGPRGAFEPSERRASSSIVRTSRLHLCALSGSLPLCSLDALGRRAPLPRKREAGRGGDAGGASGASRLAGPAPARLTRTRHAPRTSVLWTTSDGKSQPSAWIFARRRLPVERG